MSRILNEELYHFKCPRCKNSAISTIDTEDWTFLEDKKAHIWKMSTKDVQDWLKGIGSN